LENTRPNAISKGNRKAKAKEGKRERRGGYSAKPSEKISRKPFSRQELELEAQSPRRQGLSS
jgi:hypothetical protein